MRNWFALIVFLFCINSILGQGFGAPGTKWNHCLEPFSQEPQKDSLVVESVSEQIKYGLVCRTLQVTYRPSTILTLDSILICNDGDKVYYEEIDSLYLLYDFSLVAGDSFVVKYPVLFDTSLTASFPNNDIYSTLYIDSTKVINVDGISLKKQFLSGDNYGPFIIFQRYAIERIGYEHWVLPLFIHPLAEQNEFWGLSRFSDDDIKEDFGLCFFNSTEDAKISSTLTIHPNPTKNHLQITTTATRIISYSVYSTTGQLLIQETSPNPFDFQFNTSQLPQGVYFLSIRLEGEEVVRKFVKY